MDGSVQNYDRLKFVESTKRFKVGYPANKDCPVKCIAVSNLERLILVPADKSVKFYTYDQLFNDQSTNTRSSSIIDLVSENVHSMPLTFTPTIISIGRYGYNMVALIGGVVDQVPIVTVLDIKTKKEIGTTSLGIPNSEIVDYAWHPNYHDSMVVLCCSTGHLVVIRIDPDSNSIAIAYSNQSFRALCCSWSPKGKNIAIGTIDNKVFRLEPVISPEKFEFNIVDKSTHNFQNRTILPNHQVCGLSWIDKSLMIAAHATGDPNNRNVVYSLIQVKPNTPYLIWDNLCVQSAENIAPQNSSLHFHIMNLTNVVLCNNSFSTDVGVIGNMDRSQTNINNWKSLVLESRIEHPLTETYEETYARGCAIAKLENEQIILFYTSDGMINLYSAIDHDNILAMPPLQPFSKIPFQVPKQIQLAPSLFSISSSIQQPIIKHNTVSTYNPITPSLKLPTATATTNSSVEFKASSVYAQMNLIKDGLKSAIDLSQANILRQNLEDIAETHDLHKKILKFISEDIDSLVGGTLENLYLVEYIKKRQNCILKRESQDPVRRKKIESYREKLKKIQQIIKDLNLKIDLESQEYLMHRKRKIVVNQNSLELVYKTLNTNHKIINIMKKKLDHERQDEVTATPTIHMRKSTEYTHFRDFLDSRSIVPLRKATTAF